MVILSATRLGSRLGAGSFLKSLSCVALTHLSGLLSGPCTVPRCSSFGPGPTFAHGAFVSLGPRSCIFLLRGPLRRQSSESWAPTAASKVLSCWIKRKLLTNKQAQKTPQAGVGGAEVALFIHKAAPGGPSYR